MKLEKYKDQSVKSLAMVFPDKEYFKLQIINLHIRGNFTDFDTYAAAVIMNAVNRYTNYSFYDGIREDVKDVCDTHFITLYKAAFQEYMGCTFTECVNG